jgi:hypothetical protein
MEFIIRTTKLQNQNQFLRRFRRCPLEDPTRGWVLGGGESDRSWIRGGVGDVNGVRGDKRDPEALF